MSVTKGVGIPVKLLHEAEGHIVTVRSYRICPLGKDGGARRDHTACVCVRALVCGQVPACLGGVATKEVFLTGSVLSSLLLSFSTLSWN